MRIDKDTLIKKIINKTLEFMQSLGMDEDAATAYSDFDIYENDGRVVVEVRAELDYSEMDALADALNPIVQEFDDDAYFDHEGSGIINAFLSDNSIHLGEALGKIDKSLFNRYDEAFELEALYEGVEKNLTEAQKKRICEFIEMPEITDEDAKALIVEIQPEEEVAVVNDFSDCPSCDYDFENNTCCGLMDIPTAFSEGDILVANSPLDLIGGITIPAGKTFVLIDCEGVGDCPEVKFNDSYYDLDLINPEVKVAKVNALEDILADENVDMFFTDVKVPVITERLNESVKTVKPEKKVNLRESLKKRDSRDFKEDNKVMELEALYESLKSGFSDEDVKAIVDYEADEKHDSEDVAKFMKSRLDESLLSDKLVFRTEEAFKKNGFSLDKNIKHENPNWDFRGTTLHWQIVNLNHEFDVTREATDEDYAKLREIANPLADELHKIEGSVPEEFYYTWSFGVDKFGHVTAGVDLWLGKNERDEDDEDPEENVTPSKLEENLKFSNDEIKANLSDEAFQVWRVLENEGATLTRNSELGILYRDDEGNSENYPKWSDLEDDLIFTGREWKEWDFNPIDELDESLDSEYISFYDIDSSKFPNLYDAYNLEAVSLIVYNGKDMYNEKFDTGLMEEENIDIDKVLDEIRTFAKERGLRFFLDANYVESLNEDFWNPSNEFNKFVEIHTEVSNEMETEFDNWNTWDQTKRDEFATEVAKRFLDKYFQSYTFDFGALFDDLEDNNYHTELRILRKMFNERLG